jgi:hypothetical protein
MAKGKGTKKGAAKKPTMTQLKAAAKQFNDVFAYDDDDAIPVGKGVKEKTLIDEITEAFDDMQAGDEKKFKKATLDTLRAMGLDVDAQLAPKDELPDDDEDADDDIAEDEDDDGDEDEDDDGDEDEDDDEDEDEDEDEDGDEDEDPDYADIAARLKKTKAAKKVKELAEEAGFEGKVTKKKLEAFLAEKLDDDGEEEEEETEEETDEAVTDAIETLKGLKEAKVKKVYVEIRKARKLDDVKKQCKKIGLLPLLKAQPDKSPIKAKTAIKAAMVGAYPKMVEALDAKSTSRKSSGKKRGPSKMVYLGKGLKAFQGKKATTVDALAAKANDLAVEAGLNAEVDLMKRYMTMVVPCLVEMGFAKVTDDGIKILKK